MKSEDEPVGLHDLRHSLAANGFKLGACAERGLTAPAPHSPEGDALGRWRLLEGEAEKLESGSRQEASETANRIPTAETTEAPRGPHCLPYTAWLSQADARIRTADPFITRDAGGRFCGVNTTVGVPAGRLLVPNTNVPRVSSHTFGLWTGLEGHVAKLWPETIANSECLDDAQLRADPGGSQAAEVQSGPVDRRPAPGAL
jgi:hypothetical protein